MTAHHHEKWMLRMDIPGRVYCAACGQRVPQVLVVDERLIAAARDLWDPTDRPTAGTVNPEYLRAQVELIADLTDHVGYDHDHVKQVITDLIETDHRPTT